MAFKPAPQSSSALSDEERHCLVLETSMKYFVMDEQLYDFCRSVHDAKFWALTTPFEQLDFDESAAQKDYIDRVYAKSSESGKGLDEEMIRVSILIWESRGTLESRKGFAYGHVSRSIDILLSLLDEKFEAFAVLQLLEKKPELSADQAARWIIDSSVASGDSIAYEPIEMFAFATEWLRDRIAYHTTVYKHFVKKRNLVEADEVERDGSGSNDAKPNYESPTA